MEIWKPIQGFNDIYEVSNLGRVRSKDHYCENRNGVGKQTGRVLKAQKCYKGYLRVTLNENKKRFTTSVHRLIALSFIPNPQKKEQVNHINGIKDDNRLENLEWCTNRENQIHAVKNNLVKHKKSENHHNSKLSNSQVEIARSAFKMGVKNIDLAKMYGVSATAMSKILRNKTYINI